MKQIEVFYGKGYKTVSKKVERDLQWYDAIKKEMQIFKGGELNFEYRSDAYLEKMSEKERIELGFKTTYRMLPKVKDMVSKSRVFKSNKDDFNKWYNNYTIRYNSDIIKVTENNDSVILDISEDEFEDFVNEVEKEGYEYRNEI